MAQKSANAFFEPKQLLFLSADLIGSTSMKQHRVPRGGVKVPAPQEWAQVIQALYAEASREFAIHWEKAKTAGQKGRKATANSKYLGSPPILWKTIGDEIIYRKYIAKRYEIKRTITIWIDAIRDVEKTLQCFDPNLEIKCTAWMGEFPMQNRVLLGAGFSQAEIIADNPNAIPENLASFHCDPVPQGWEIDFIGPAIDVGFRLSKLSTARKFVLSLDTAYFLMSEGFDMSIFYDGTIKLSGVLNGQGYPVFWIDMNHDAEVRESETLEDRLLERSPVNPATGKAFCEAFYKERSNLLDKPFIPTDENEEIRSPPKWYKDAIREAKQLYSPRPECRPVRKP